MDEFNYIRGSIVLRVPLAEIITQVDLDHWDENSIDLEGWVRFMMASNDLMDCLEWEGVELVSVTEEK